jgi:peptidyl-prolyl cis-trans isomerase D
LPRLITAADSAIARNKALALRAEIVKGAKFADVARRESADTASAAQGGVLPKAGRTTYVKPFADAAYSLKVGEISQPVLTPFGYHIIRLESRQGDSVIVAHILVRIQQGDSAATATDRRADQLAKAGGAAKPSMFDSAAKTLRLATRTITVQEGVTASFDGSAVPGATAWAFSGAKPGEIGELIDSDDAYYLVRLDSLTPGGEATVEALKTEIHALLAREKKLDLIMPKAQQIAMASKGSTLEAAAIPAGFATIVSPSFARTSQVVGLGVGNAAIGAAFGLPLKQVGEPVKATTTVIIERVDVRTLADSAAFEKNKVQQRLQAQQRIREQAVQQYVQNLRENASITDKRKDIQAAQRQPAS